MFELHIATVLVDGSEHEIALSVASLSYLSMKQQGHVSNIEKYRSEVKGVSYRVERIPFGETASTESLPD
jgi:hypothetical protein